MPAFKVGTGQGDKIKTCGQMVREQRIAGEILGRMLIVGVDSLRAHARPVARSIVIPPEPHEGYEIDLFVVGKVRDERGQFFLHRIIRLILQDRRILVVRWIGARVRLGRRFLCIELTRLHDDEAQRLQRNRQLRRLVTLGSRIKATPEADANVSLCRGWMDDGSGR